MNTPGEYDGRVGGKGLTLSNISPLVDDVAIGFQSPESLMVLSGYEILSSLYYPLTSNSNSLVVL